VAAVPLRDIQPIRALLEVKPFGVFSDIDGTLSPIVRRHEDARVTPRCSGLLQDLLGANVRVALITGRRLAAARSLVGIERAAYAANHGLEFWIEESMEVAEGVPQYAGLVERVLAEAGDLREAGVEIELKGPGVAFHYRRARHGEKARAAILRAIESPTAVDRFTVLEGRKVFELRPKIDANKGTATRVLARRLGVRGVVSIGDDRTDVDMFHAVAALREEGIEGRSIAVLSPEVVPDLLEAADYMVEGVPGVEWLLGELEREITQKAG
jgi:trehalose 6-phosphate phosphatase